MSAPWLHRIKVFVPKIFCFEDFRDSVHCGGNFKYLCLYEKWDSPLFPLFIWVLATVLGSSVSVLYTSFCLISEFGNFGAEEFCVLVNNYS